MVKSMFAAISGLRSHQSKMDVISNNIANVNTWGYKTRSANFQDSIYQNVVSSTGGDEDAGGVGGVNASQLGFGVNVGSISTNFASGSWSYTGYGLNCMIDGSGFFIVGGMEGTVPTGDIATSNLAFSRVGIFSIEENGYLVDDTGNYVYGFDPVDPTDIKTTFDTANLNPIQIPTDPTTGERYNISAVRIANDGSVLGVTTDNEEVMIGKLAVASVENPNGLEQKAGYIYEIGANAGQIVAQETVATTTGAILSGYLEMSNVDLATEMSTMITTQRGYQANSKIITVTDEMLEQLVNMKR